jgi:hypothetical protein
MNKDSVLKKEFKQSDVQRVRNIVNGKKMVKVGLSKTVLNKT